MEMILSLIIISAIGLIMGINPLILLSGVGIILCILPILLLIFGLCFLFIFIKSEKREAIFIKTAKKNNKKPTYAIYKIDDKEYPCFFPSEKVFKKIPYKENKLYHVRLHKRLGRVFDKWATATTFSIIISSIFLILFGLLIYIL